MMKISSLSVKNVFLGSMLVLAGLSGGYAYGMNSEDIRLAELMNELFLALGLGGADHRRSGADMLVGILEQQEKTLQDIIDSYSKDEKIKDVDFRFGNEDFRKAILKDFLSKNLVPIYLYCLKKGFLDVNGAKNFNGRGFSPLLAAVCFGDQQLIEALLKCGADPNQSMKYDEEEAIGIAITPLLTAIRFNDSEIINLIRKYSEPFQVNEVVAQEAKAKAEPRRRGLAHFLLRISRDTGNERGMVRAVCKLERAGQRRVCESCGQGVERDESGKVAAFPTCGICRQVAYCSQECQRVDWKKHKKVCREPGQDLQDAPAAAAAGLFPDFVGGQQVQERDVVSAGPSASVLQECCAACSKVEEGSNFFVYSCGKCKKVSYCSEECKNNHKNEHKRECRK